MDRIDPRHWGRDHWELLARIAREVRDPNGFLRANEVTLERKSMRVNPNRHPTLFCRGNWRIPRGWRRGDSYPNATSLRDHKRVPGHDDFDVLDDMVHAGWLEVLNKKGVHLRLTWPGISLVRVFMAEVDQGTRPSEFVFNPESLKEHNHGTEPEPVRRDTDSPAS